ncbi:MAG: GAF domain-containing protein [Anaerolineales bacterium]|nr:GAF domain-containing protein [Anaerolineales bacterium]
MGTLIGWLNGQLSNSDDKQAGRRSFAADREKQLEREIERLRIVNKLIGALNATLNYELVLSLALDLVDEVLIDPAEGAARPKSAILLFEDNQLQVAIARGLSQADMRTRLPGRKGIVAEALNTSEVTVCFQPSQDPELRRLTALQVARVVVCMPLSAGMKMYGVLLFAHRQQEYFSEDRLQLLETVAQQIMIAFQNARLYSELEEEKERIVEIQEEARKKLARDLHDGPAQSISAIAMRINFSRKLLERDPKATLEELERIEELALRTTKEIRQMLFTLRPLALESQGLMAALQQLADKMKETYQQQVHIEAFEDIDESMELNRLGVVFYIIEEAVNNARKHASAKNIWVRMQRSGDLVVLEVEDDGVGFNLEEIQQNYEQRGSLGMVNLQERSELISGLLEIESHRGSGTCIRVTIPLTEEAAAPLHRPGFAA